MNGDLLEQPDYLPISMLNQLEYCERRFWLMYVHGEMAINAPVLEGIQQHERVHSGGLDRDGEVIVHRRIYLWSDRLRLSGLADLLEEREGALVPIEYKHGRMGRWLSDQVQLCAQALCLEERTGQSVHGGQIFYWSSRRRVTVEFTPTLREHTEAVAARGFALIEGGRMPAPIDHRTKCRDCSLENICLPREVLLLSQEQE